jgi:hypothetical protein
MSDRLDRNSERAPATDWSSPKQSARVGCRTVHCKRTSECLFASEHFCARLTGAGWERRNSPSKRLSPRSRQVYSQCKSSIQLSCHRCRWEEFFFAMHRFGSRYWLIVGRPAGNAVLGCSRKAPRLVCPQPRDGTDCAVSRLPRVFGHVPAGVALVLYRCGKSASRRILFSSQGAC